MKSQLLNNTETVTQSASYQDWLRDLKDTIAPLQQIHQQAHLRLISIRESVSPEFKIVETLTPQLIHRRSNLKELGYE